MISGSPSLRVLLVGNYPPDEQESMQRFAGVLARELAARGISVTAIAPRAIVGPRRRTGAVAKWLGYIDKFVLFPVTLQRVLRDAAAEENAVVVHICDHSNAIYTRYLTAVPHVVTCNDMLAVRSALGEFPQNRVRWSGRVLQKLIVSGLNRARLVACISEATREDVLRLCRLSRAAVYMIHMGSNFPYARVEFAAAQRLLAPLLDHDVAFAAPHSSTRPFIVHVGGNQWYKNRIGVLRIYSALRRMMNDADTPALLMVGAPFTGAMRDFIVDNSLGRHVVELNRVSNETLAAIYSRAELLLYPSLAEGFGWPVSEAMACGCRVVTTNRAPLTEVGGDVAIYIDPADEHAAAASVRLLLAELPSERRDRVERGVRQQAKFSTERMMEHYIDLYHHALGAAPAPAVVPL